MAVISNDTATKMVEYEKTYPPPMSQEDNYPYDYLLLRDSGINRSLLVEVLMWRLGNENKLFYAQLKLTVSKWPFDAIPPSLQDILSIIEEIEDLHYFIKGRKDEHNFLIVSWDKDDHENMIYRVIGYGQLSEPKQLLINRLQGIRNDKEKIQNEKENIRNEKNKNPTILTSISTSKKKKEHEHD